MDFKKRDELIGFLNKIEEKYPVSSWSHEDVYFWPLLKNIIFFKQYRRSSVETINKLSSSFRKKVLNKAKHQFNKYNFIGSLLPSNTLSQKHIDFLFAGAITYRVQRNGKLYNRYFDPMMDYLETHNNLTCQQFDYIKIDKKDCYKSQRNFDITKLFAYNAFKLKYKNVNIGANVSLIDCLDEINSFTGLSSSKIVQWLDISLKEILIWKLVWLSVLRKCRPKYVFGLCYYSNPIYGLNLASYDLGIPTIDMQHGGQGYLHPSYYFTELKDGGYNLLPKIFWVWNENSKNSIEQFLSVNGFHETILGGNPWIEHLLNEPDVEKLPRGKKVILYTLQTSLRPVLSDSIIEAIKATTDGYVWWLRLHPRMSHEEKQMLNDALIKNSLLDKVEIAQASVVPLPVILSKCAAHISNYSGSIEEAAIMNTPVNIIISDVGKIAYQKLIESNEAQYYDEDHNGNLFNYIQQLENTASVKKEVSAVSYRAILDDFVKK